MSHRTSSDAASGHDNRGRDVVWNFGESVDGSRTKIKCTFCGKVINGGITRLKEHLGHVKGNVAKCNNVTTDVRRNMEQLLQEMKNYKMEKRRRDLIVEEEITRTTLRGEDEDEDEEDEHVQAILRRSRLEADLEYEQNRYMMDHHEHYHEGGSSRQQPLRPMGRSSSLSVRGSRGLYEYAPSSTLTERLATMDASLEREHQKMKQTKINPGTKAFKMLKGKLRKAWGQWITHNKVQFSAVESPFTKPLMTTIREVGERVPPPSAYELAEVYFKEEYQSLKKWTDSLLPQWKQWGVTIMCDGWTGPTKMHLINFLIYSKMGTVFHKSVDATNVPSKDAEYYFRLMKKVVEEVGPEIVIQVVTDNEAAIKAGGKKLMQEFPHLYWTGCAAHCIDLILADISKKSNIHKVLQMAQSITQFIYRYDKVVAIMLQFTNGRQLLRPGITRFATNFIALESIIKHKSSLRNMWESEQWKCSKYGQMNDDHAIQVRDIILQLTEEGRKFWSKANDVIKVQEPLVKVLRLVDGDQKPTMGFLYEAMERAKLAIKKNCRYWERYWQIIDHRWDFQLHHDLHAAGYFLNPEFTYERHDYNIREDEEVMRGVKKVIQRLEPNIDNQIRALNELEIYSLKQEDFSDIVTQRAVKFTNPGLVTKLTDDQKYGMIEAIAHLIHRDYEAIVKDFVKLGFIPDGVNLEPILPVLAKVFDQALEGGGAKNINFQELASDLAQITFDYPFRIPPYFALIIRAIGVLEGIALVGNPDFAIVDEAYPYIAQRLLTDESPRLRNALRYTIYGKAGVFDAARFIDVMQAFENFITAAKSGGGETLNGQMARLGILEPTSIAITVPASISQSDVQTRASLVFLLSEKGSFFLEFLLDEIVKGIDAVTRDQLVRIMAALGPVNAAPAFSMIPALGSFRRSALLPTVTEEDRVILNNIQRIVEFLTAGRSLSGPTNTAADVAHITRELLPLLPGISARVLPEVLNRLTSRIMARLIRDTFP